METIILCLTILIVLFLVFRWGYIRGESSMLDRLQKSKFHASHYDKGQR